MSAPAPRGDLSWWEQLRPVLVALLVGLVLGGLVGWWLTSLQGAPPVPYGTAPLLVGLTVVVAGLAVALQGRVQRRREPVEPENAVTWLGLARTALFGGAAIAGFFAWWLVDALSRSAPTAYQVQRGLHSGLALGAALALSAAGWFLQRALRVPPRDDASRDERG